MIVGTEQRGGAVLVGKQLMGCINRGLDFIRTTGHVFRKHFEAQFFHGLAESCFTDMRGNRMRVAADISDVAMAQLVQMFDRLRDPSLILTTDTDEPG